ncbi:protein kinase-like domain, concanavalin A-like lectin/glucanase domain protein [Tanacetum coccineum]
MAWPVRQSNVAPQIAPPVNAVVPTPLYATSTLVYWLKPVLLSHKSDVYSYGMMILEMVGGRKNIEVEVDHTSEIYFPHWIYKKVEFHEEQLGLHGIVSEEENEMVRKMIIVGLWCIQTNPLSRPTITKKHWEMVGKTDLASLEFPPRPIFVFSPRYVGFFNLQE